MKPRLTVRAPEPARIRVLHVASEVAPFSKTGGLADVTAALPRAIATQGVRAMVVTPFYRGIDAKRHALARRLIPLQVPLGHRVEEVILHEGRLPGGTVPVYFVDHPWFQRDGLYGEDGVDYPDNGLRFALLARAALEICHRTNEWPDIVHGHDWPAGLAMVYAKRGAVAGRPAPATVMTVHNLAFQGLQPRALMDELQLGWDLWSQDGVEFYDQLSFLKAGLAFADVITTVSPRYAKEICTAEHGAGLEGFLRARADHIVGVLNGIDVEPWNTLHDPLLPAHYSVHDHAGKTACKAALQRELRLPERASVPLVASISRLTEQKGFDLIEDAGEELAQMDAQWVFLGSGDSRYEKALMRLRDRYPTKVALRLGHEEDLAHRIFAGADLFLMPSRFEPCGLNQLYALRYGAIPVVRAVGGLDDTVVDFDEKTRTGTGFKFDDYTATALLATVRHALAVFQQKSAWNDLVSHAMSLDNTWETSARRYVEVYERVTGRPARG